MPRQGTAVQPRDILDLTRSDFVPLTGATLVFLPKPAITFQAGVVIVNRAQVAVVGLLPRPVATV
jgi:hypothetical protein